jgi:hypothetical protein
MIRAGRLRMLLLACLFCFLSHAAVATETLSLRGHLRLDEKVTTVAAENFEIEAREEEHKWAPDIIKAAVAARRRLNEVTRDALMVRIRMILAPTQQLFLQLAGGGAENSVAVAVGGQQLVIINMEQLRSQGFERFGNVLVHELAHVYLDVRCTGPVPRWLHEGIAQTIAGEATGSASSLLLAKMLGQLIPLSDIERRFPTGLEREQLAYRESYSVVEFLIAHRHDGSMPALLSSIRGDEGLHNVELYWSPVYRDALQSQWRATIGGWREWAGAVATSGSFWTLIAALTVLAWFVRRRRNKDLRREWDEEEKLYLVLDEEERKLYGDEDPDNDPYAVEGEYVDPEYEDVYENGEYKGTRRTDT